MKETVDNIAYGIHVVIAFAVQLLVYLIAIAGAILLNIIKSPVIIFQKFKK